MLPSERLITSEISHFAFRKTLAHRESEAAKHSTEQRGVIPLTLPVIRQLLAVSFAFGDPGKVGQLSNLRV